MMRSLDDQGPETSKNPDSSSSTKPETSKTPDDNDDDLPYSDYYTGSPDDSPHGSDDDDDDAQSSTHLTTRYLGTPERVKMNRKQNKNSRKNILGRDSRRPNPVGNETLKKLKVRNDNSGQPRNRGHFDITNPPPGLLKSNLKRQQQKNWNMNKKAVNNNMSKKSWVKW